MCLSGCGTIYAENEVIWMYIQRLGDAVKDARTRRNLSQNTLKERTYVSLRTISDKKLQGKPVA